MRIKYIIPFAFGEEGVAKRAAQIPTDILGTKTNVECIPVKNHATLADTYYELSIFDMYVTEAGLRAEEEGYDAVVMDSTTDSGLYTLRSRLSIPVIGPGLVAYAVALMLGRRFSVIAYSERHKFQYEKNLDMYRLRQHCASIRAANIEPDFEALFKDDGHEEFEKLTLEGWKAIREDGADVILLGSTTMYQAGDYMGRELPAPVINPGPVAIKLTEAIVDLGLSHSKIAFPSPSRIEDDKWFSLISLVDGRR